MPKLTTGGDEIEVPARLIVRMADRLHRFGPARREAYIEKVRLSRRGRRIPERRRAVPRRRRRDRNPAGRFPATRKPGSARNLSTLRSSQIRGFPPNSATSFKRVGVALWLQRNNGVVRSASGPGQFMLWEIAR
jgi:hypothetical protein